MSKSEEMFALWREMKLGIPAMLTIEPLIAVQQAWRNTPCEPAATLAAMREANRQGIGLWQDIVEAGIRAVRENEQAAFEEYQTAMQRTEGMTSETLKRSIQENARRRYCEQSRNALVTAWGLEPELLEA